MPRHCIVCGRTLGGNERHICIYCNAELPLTRNWNRPHNDMSDRFNAMMETHAEGDLHDSYCVCASLLRYIGEYKRIPQSLKYKYDIPAGKYFAAMLGKRLAKSPDFADVDVVIPVPLHRSRMFRRGYNQAEVIARIVAEELGATLRTDILERRRRTRTQTTLGIEGKYKNVSTAFTVRHSFVPDEGISHILLIDDVFTTGATSYACYKALRGLFPRSIKISVSTLSSV